MKQIEIYQQICQHWILYNNHNIIQVSEKIPKTVEAGIWFQSALVSSTTQAIIYLYHAWFWGKVSMSYVPLCILTWTMVILSYLILDLDAWDVASLCSLARNPPGYYPLPFLSIPCLVSASSTVMPRSLWIWSFHLIEDRRYLQQSKSPWIGEIILAILVWEQVHVAKCWGILRTCPAHFRCLLPTKSLMESDGVCP